MTCLLSVHCVQQLAALKVDPAQRTTPIISIDIKWSEVSKELSGLRTAKQCRERYSNHLDPTLKKTAWSADEDVQLMKAQASLGNSWTKISQQMPGRRFGCLHGLHMSLLLINVFVFFQVRTK